MNEAVTIYIQKLPSWQSIVVESLRTMVHTTIPEIEERVHYGKPHYLKNGQYVAVISVAKDAVTFMFFNASTVDQRNGLLRPLGNGDRMAVDITEQKSVDYAELAGILVETTSGL